jgi:hypothetical protein
MHEFKLLSLPLKDINDNRLDTLRQELEKDCELLPAVIEMLIDFTKDFPPEDDGLLTNCESRLVEAHMWAENWIGEDEVEEEIKRPDSRGSK